MTVKTISLSKDEIKELVSKNWITHDAMWFYHCLQEFGIEKTNQLNKAAIRDMSAIEIKRIHKAMGAGPISTFDEFQHFFDAAMEIATGKFMKYRYTSPAHNLVHGEWDSCFAHEGMKALGLADRYECGVLLRINTWFDTMGIKYELKPNLSGCLMHTDGKCVWDYRFFYDK